MATAAPPPTAPTVRYALPLAAAGFIACGGTSTPSADPTAVVRAMLDASAAAWNGGDLDGFMADYARDSTTTFVSGGRVQYGYDWIREAYAPRFAPGAERDSLRFEAAAGRALGDEHLLATARWVLYRGDTVTASGPFTLVLRRHANGWRIVHDHSSTDPN